MTDWLGDIWGWLGDDFWPWWDAARVQVLLTVLTLGTALGLAARSEIRRWRRRPKLRFELGADEPFVRMARSPGNKHVVGDQIHLRVGVRNVGKDPARRVTTKLNRWIEHDGNKWVERDIDPMALHWVELPLADEQGNPRPEIDIFPGERTFVDLFARLWEAGENYVQAHDQRDRGIDRRARHPARHQAFELLTWRESATEPAVLHLEVAFFQEMIKPRVRQLKSLPETVSREGIMKMLGKAVEPLTDEDRRDLGVSPATVEPHPEEPDPAATSGD